jgi:stage V sporulation protein SpoVS
MGGQTVTRFIVSEAGFLHIQQSPLDAIARAGLNQALQCIELARKFLPRDPVFIP